MSLHADLLAQAEHLAQLESGRPKQASLRRAISSAYYACSFTSSRRRLRRCMLPSRDWLRG